VRIEKANTEEQQESLPAVLVNLNKHVIIHKILAPFALWLWIQWLQHKTANNQTEK
jgi:hypothetical protein